MIDRRKKKFLLYVFSSLLFLLVLFSVSGLLNSVLVQEKKKVQPVSTPSAERVTLYYNNKPVAADAHLFTKQSVVYMEAAYLFKQASIPSSFDQKTLSFTYQSLSFSHTVGAKTFSLNHENYTFLYKPIVKREKVYYSAEDVSRILALTIKWDTRDDETVLSLTRSYKGMLSLILSDSDDVDETNRFLAFEWLYDAFTRQQTPEYTGYEPARNPDGSLAKLVLPSSVPDEVMTLAKDDPTATSDVTRSLLIGRYQIEEGRVVSGTEPKGRYLHVVDHEDMDWELEHPEMGSYIKSVYLP